jgi:hypothetical protein
MRGALVASLIVALFVLVGCDAGDVAKNATGFHTTSFKSIYAPKLYCDEVKDEVGPPDLEAEVAYRVVCLKNRQFGRNLLKACRQAPASVQKQYWSYNPASDEAGYITCDYLEQLGY